MENLFIKSTLVSKTLSISDCKTIQGKIELPPIETAAPTEEWMNLKTASKYLGVSENTLYKFRVHRLKILEIDNVKRVSKSDLDRFIKKNSN